MPKLSRGFDPACVLPQSPIKLCDWRVCRQRGLHCPDLLRGLLQKGVGWDWCRASLSSGWDERHLKITWMLPHRFSSRSAGNHFGSRAIVRVHGISRDWGNHLLLGQQSCHSSGLRVSGKELFSAPMHRSFPNLVHSHEREDKVDQGSYGNIWEWTCWPAGKTSYREPFHRAWADNSRVILLL